MTLGEALEVWPGQSCPAPGCSCCVQLLVPGRYGRAVVQVEAGLLSARLDVPCTSHACADPGRCDLVELEGLDTGEGRWLPSVSDGWMGLALLLLWEVWGAPPTPYAWGQPVNVGGAL